MIGLDSNILVRYFTQDDPVQAALATEVIERRLSEAEPGFVSIVAMAETVWVLDRHYRFGREQIANAVETVLRTDVLLVDDEPEVFTALAALREGRGEFADALIGAHCDRAGCSRVLSFDHCRSVGLAGGSDRISGSRALSGDGRGPGRDQKRSAPQSRRPICRNLRKR